MTRTILIKSLYELWATGTNYEELKSNLLKFPAENKEPFFSKDLSYSVRVETFNKVLPFQEKISKIETILDEAVLPFKGPINLKKPQQQFGLLEYYLQQVTPAADELGIEAEIIYFGRWLADGQRENIKKYHLQQRKYIGNTSMDAGLSLIMTNMGHVQPGTLVLDPFVGTGSLLVSSAHFGAYVMGTELDVKVLHGWGRSCRHTQKLLKQDEHIRANFIAYGLENHYVDSMVADASKHRMWRDQPIFNAIITDPPYGIREKTKKLGSKDEDLTGNVDEMPDTNISKPVNYGLVDIYLDLLNFAAKYLLKGGRLVFWLPIIRSEYSDDNLPSHPCLKLVANSEQVFNVRISRRLITMEKVADFKPSDPGHKATMRTNIYNDLSFREQYFLSEQQETQTGDPSAPKLQCPPTEDISSHRHFKQVPLDGNICKDNENIEFSEQGLNNSTHESGLQNIKHSIIDS